jgi:hypothetical protein
MTTLPVRNGTTERLVYTTYLFGPGAFGKGAAPLAATPLQGGIGTEGVEFARVPLDSDTCAHQSPSVTSCIRAG